MKKLIFYSVVIIAFILLLNGHWSIAMGITTLCIVILLPSIPGDYHRFQEISNLFLSVEEDMSDNKQIEDSNAIQMQKSLKNLRDVIQSMEDAKLKMKDEPDEEKKKRMIESFDKRIVIMSKMIPHIEEQIKSYKDFFDYTTHSYYQTILNEYIEYTKENRLYHYKPSKSQMDLLIAAITFTKEKMELIKMDIEKSKSGTFFVRLEKVDEAKKIEIIKVIKNLTNLSLREAKDKVDAVILGSMSIIIENINQEEANRIKEQLELYGGTCVVIDDKPVL